MFERKKYRLSQSVTALLLALLLVIAAMPLTPALAQVAEGTDVNLHAEHKTVKRREKKGRNVERLNLSGVGV